MVKLNRVKITVLRRFKPEEVFEKQILTPVEGDNEDCSVFKDGQEFIVEGSKMPEGFCGSAWNALFGNVRLLQFGGDLPWYKERGVAVNCCIDGLRPVIFKLERI